MIFDLFCSRVLDFKYFKYDAHGMRGDSVLILCEAWPNTFRSQNLVSHWAADLRVRVNGPNDVMKNALTEAKQMLRESVNDPCWI